jgi:hypothetical protein
MLLLDGVAVLPHRFGGIEFRLGKRELGHIHGDSLLDIPFPMSIRNELVESGEVKKHHLLPESGWVSFSITREADVAKAIALLRRSFDIAVTSAQRRQDTTSHSAH